MEALSVKAKVQKFEKNMTLLYQSPSSQPQLFIDHITQL